jgi:polyferredoxin
MLRPRVLVYTGVLAALVAGMAASIALRNPLKLDVIRDRGSMGREVEDGMIENVYRLQVMNTSEQAQRLRIAVAGIASVSVAGEDVVEMDAASTRAVPVRVRIEPGAARPGSNKIDFTLSSATDPHLAVSEDAVFIVPK